MSREYIVFGNNEKPELFNTQEAILNVNPKLDSTIKKQERTVFDSFKLVGNLGGLNEVLFRTMAPVVGLLIGSRFDFLYSLSFSGSVTDIKRKMNRENGASELT